MKIQLKEVILLKSEKNVYQNEDDVKFIYVLNKINKQYITLQ